MKRSRFTQGQIIGIVRELELELGASVLDLCRRHGLSSANTDKPLQPSLRGLFLAHPLL